MSWDQYITNLTTSEFVDDAAIVGIKQGQESVWAASPNGWLRNITPAEVRAVNATDRSSLFISGVTLAGRKCTVLRDALNQDGQYTMDIKMKVTDQEPNPLSITIGKTISALIIAKGAKDAPGGKVNPPVYDMTQYLRKQNM